jgi:ABC-type multidrug transport system ATPase subunit
MPTKTNTPTAGKVPPESQMETVRVANVSKRYGQRAALRGVSFAAHAGEAVALWGANGAGKSTLLKAMLGLVSCQGEIVINGQNVARAGKGVRRQVGYVPQEMAFYDERVRATLSFYAQLKRISEPRVDELIDRLGLAGHAHSPVAALSGGLKQRLALAVALLADPPVLLLDEPTANLDAAAQQDYLRLLADLRTREGKTILFASHRLEEVEALANRVLLLEQGELVAVVTPAELLARVLPEIELTLWVPADRRLEAVSTLAGAGWSAHANGRGTVVVRVRAEDKAQPFQALQARGIAVDDFELARGGTWN